MTGEVRHHAAEALTDVCTGHGEGVVWDRPAGLLRFVDLEAGALMTYDPATSAVARRQLGKVVACVRPRRGGGLVVALERSFVLLGAGGEVVAEYGPVFDEPGIRFNDGGCDPAGRFWMGTMAYDETPGAGSIHRLDPDGTTHLVLKNVTISNGLSFAPDGRSAYYVDTPTSRIDLLEIDRGRHGGRPPPVRRGRRSPRRDRRRHRRRGVGGAVGRIGRQPLRRAGATHGRRPAALLAGDAPRSAGRSSRTST